MGSSEILIIILFILILFGPNKIPEILKHLGKGMKEFKDSASDLHNTKDNSD
tara:strand:- start:59 stop:214 length:156 start_codon:yes stop_codon:yes gene_type:complete